MLKRIFVFLAVGTFLAGSRASAIEPECISWFKKSKIVAADKNCRTTCSSLGVDLGTFYCPDRCDDLCRSTTSCEERKKQFERKIGKIRPAQWQYPSEHSRAWKSDETKAITNALEDLPGRLIDSSSFEIFRMDHSVVPGNPGSNFKNSIVLYDESFAKRQNVERILAHELAHIWYQSDARLQSRFVAAANWLETASGIEKPGRKAEEFVQPDGANSSEEDFANDIEYFLFETATLKKKSNGVHEWLRHYLGDSFKLGATCENTH